MKLRTIFTAAMAGVLALCHAWAAEIRGTYSTVEWNWWDSDPANAWSKPVAFLAAVGPTIVNGNFQTVYSNASWVHTDGLPVQGDARYSNFTGTILAKITYYTAPHITVTQTVLSASFTSGNLTAVRGGIPSANTGVAANPKLQKSGNWLSKLWGPIELASGAESFDRPLFAFSGARNWSFGLSHHSVLAANQTTVNELGQAWSHPFQARLRTSGSNLILDWTASRSNTFTPEPGVTGSYISTEDATRYDRITAQTGGGWLLVRRDQSSLLFNSSGRLIEDRDPHGRKLVLTYASDRLSRIADPVSNTRLDFAYDGNGRLWTLTDAAAGVVTLTFTNNLLTKITNQNGKETTFTYNSTRGLLTLTDHNGVTLTANTYDTSGRVYEQEDGIPGNRAQLSWREVGMPGNAVFAPSDTAESLPLIASVPGKFSVSSFVGLNGQTVSYNYDGDGRLLSATSGTQTASLTYDAEGNIATVTDPASTTTAVQPAIVVTATDRNGKVSTHTFNPDFRLRSVKNALNETTSYTYDAQGNVTSITNPKNEVTQFTYDSRGNVLTTTDPAGKVTTFTYDARNNLLTTTDPANNVTTRTYDAANNLLTVTDALGRTTTWTYDTNSQPLTMTLPGGGVYTYAYTGGRLTQLTDPNSVVTKFGYDANGRVLYREDAALKRVSHSYDSVGNLLTITNGLNQTITFTYDHRNRLLTRTDAGGAVTTYTYDHNNSLTSVTDPLGKISMKTYDAEERIKTETTADPDLAQTGAGRDPLTTTYNYDDAGRLKETISPDGKVTRFEYDSAGRANALEDPLGRRTTTTFDVRGLPLTLTDPLSRTTTYTYDDLGRRISAKDALNRTATYGYDALHRLTTVTDPGNLTAIQAFDLDGNRTGLTNPAANATTFSYDLGGRLTASATPEGRGSSQTYDTRGLPQTATDASGRVRTFTYDDATRLSAFTDPIGTVSFTRDAAGRVLTVVEGAKTITREYDLLGRVTKFTDGDGNVLQYAYDDIGRLKKLTYPDLKEVAYTYDAAGRLHTVTDWANRVTTYTYDAVGRLTETQRPNGTKQTRSYDAAGQLTQLRELAADGTTVIHASDSVTYDLAGRLTGETLIPAIAPQAYTASQTFDRDNRLLTHNGAATTFDADGNLLSIASGVFPASYTYDARRRLTSAGSLSYTYDAENRRAGITDATGTTRFAINPNAAPDQVLVRTAPDGTKTFYVHGLGLLHEETGSAVRYYHHNRRGDTVALTDGNGAVTDRAAYGVYGELVSRTGSTNTPFLFNGRWGVQTDASGIYYHRARYYHPALRRFLNQDVVLGGIANGASMNRFAYANGNPVSFIDPFGLMAMDVLFNADVFVEAYALWEEADRYLPEDRIMARFIAVIGMAAATGDVVGNLLTGGAKTAVTGSVKTAVKVATHADDVVDAVKAAETTVHRGSRAFVGESHVYVIRAPDGALHKVGKSSQGVRATDGASKRAEQQVRQLNRQDIENGGVGGYESEIRKTFDSGADALDYERALRGRYRRMFGEDLLPGNREHLRGGGQ